jgi:hypothetical protein
MTKSGHDWDGELYVCRACGLTGTDVMELGREPPCYPSPAGTAVALKMRRQMEATMEPIMADLRSRP